MSNRAACVLFAVLAVPACGGASKSDFFGEPSAGANGTTGGASGSGTSGGAGGTKATGGGSGKGGSGTGGSATGGTGASGGTSGSGAGGSGAGGSATGGTGGSGASGGTSGEAGAAGEGSGATGGSATGGASGAAGSAGMATGGVGGSAGSGGAHAGNGGSAGSSTEKECAALAEEYAKALEEALACNAESARAQCMKLVTSNLECGCGVWVNPDNEEAVAELERISTEAGQRCAVLCPAIACVPPTGAGCFQGGKPGGGRCTPG